MAGKEYDIAVVGATGFTGKLVARWLIKQQQPLKWCIVGRSQSKLNDVHAELAKLSDDGAKDVGIVVADTVSDFQACEKVTAKARVVLTTVGPYAKYGEKLVRACAESGTHYCDLTGELPWYRAMLVKYSNTAKRTGAVLIPCSGFDSVPSDMANWLVAKTVRERYNTGTTNARTVIEEVRGGVSGGTLASLCGLMDAYSLKDIGAAHSPKGIIAMDGSQLEGSAYPPTVAYDDQLKTWTTSWLGDNVDGNVARRSAHLLKSYGDKYDTRGYINMGAWWKAASFLAGTIFGSVSLAIPPIRWLALRVVTQPGFGPSEETMMGGMLKLRGFGQSDADPSKKVSVTITGDKDPGYALTAQIIAAVAITLAFDLDRTEAGKIGGGFMTPATLGDRLRQRLEEAELSIRVD